MKRPITLPAAPKRIVSLVPSQTELLHDLGLGEEVLGITKFCIHPTHWFQGKMRVGGTKTVDIEKVKRLKPDLIIANKEENVQEQIETLAKDFPVWLSDINTLTQALEMIEMVGQLTGRELKAHEMVTNIRTDFSQLQTQTLLNTAYLIWREPYMTVGHDTFIHEMLLQAGFKNVFGNLKRYPSVTVEEIKSSNCELLLLSSEPYPFKQKHVDELKQQLPKTKIMLVDGEMFSWYGSRLLHAPEYFKLLQEQVRTMV